ncbi:MAG: hypothetical protein AB7L09_01690 [Nitrospira sp.]
MPRPVDRELLEELAAAFRRATERHGQFIDSAGDITKSSGAAVALRWLWGDISVFLYADDSMRVWSRRDYDILTHSPARNCFSYAPSPAKARELLASLNQLLVLEQLADV